MKKLFTNKHWYDCECKECLKIERILRAIKILIVILLCLISFLAGWFNHSRTFWERPYTVNERQTWFRENGYLDVNEPKNFDGKCGKLLHDAEKNALFWNYERIEK